MFNSIAQQARNCGFASSANLFGLPNVISLLLVRRLADGGISKQEIRTIKNLIWEKSSPKTYSPDSAGGEVEAREDEFTISGIPRNFDAVDWLQATGTSYWVNGEMRDDSVVSGTEVEFVTIRENNPLVFELTVRRKPDERRFR